MAVIVEWFKTENSVSYTIERSDTGKADTFTEIATGLPGLQFLDPTGGTDKFYTITGVDSLGEDLVSRTPSALYDAKLVCKIFGEVLDGTGRPETEAEIRFEVRQDDAPQVVQGIMVTQDMKTVLTNEVGTFEIYMLRDLLVEIFIPNTQFKALFMVPDEDEKNFTELIPDSGFETKITNPF
jgi:hypothetical protein